MKKKRVLFVCTANSARSQMAQVLLHHKAADTFDSYSAGTEPDTVDQRTIMALNKYGINASELSAKSIDVFAGQSFDYVITVCDNANNECRQYPGAHKQFAWDFADPKMRLDDDPFFTTLTEINQRLTMFLAVEGDTGALNTHTQALAVIDPVSFYKCLSDSVRLKTLMLTHYHGELCVCEIMHALQENSQPKVSRNLAVLKKQGILTTRKHGQWVFYRLNPALPPWAKTVIAQSSEHNLALIYPHLQQLDKMQDRPDKENFC
ncbi:metalloregulator ArsR/SmtB family transcription factor [Gammaproteobacteria bacterium AS21]